MIQSLHHKPVDAKPAAKAAVGANKSNAKGEAKTADLESSLEGADFENELMASLAGEEASMVVKPVEVAPEMKMEKPSLLIDAPQAGQPESINPKIFDPAMTKGVEQMIRPEASEVPVEGSEAIKVAAVTAPVSAMDQLLKAQAPAANPVAAQVANPEMMAIAEGEFVKPEAEGEIPQTLLKTPQIQTGRAPAIDFAQTEVDPQLLNLEDFVAQKNLAVKKSVSGSAYGMPQVQTKKAGLENGLKSTQTINELPASEAGNGASVNSQAFILNSMVDQKSGSAQMNEAQAPVKTFDMSHIKSSNPDQIMTQITDYIVQAKAAKEPTVNMRMNHDELGMIDITVQKTMGAIPGQESVAISIGAHSVDGKNFFQQNSKDLFSHLTTAGINVSDMKVETPSQTAKNDFDFGQQSSRQGQGSEKNFGSEQNQRRHDSDRRQDLWKLLADKEAA